MSLSTVIKSNLLRFFSSKKKNNFDIATAKKILYFRYDGIGDMIISTPVFRELKLAYPLINISVLASELNQDVLINNPYIDQVFLNKKNRFFFDILILLKLRKNKYDICVDFDHSVIPHSIIRLKIINPKLIISVAKDGRYGVKGNELNLYDIYTKKLAKSHFRDIWLETLSPFRIKPKSKKYDIFCKKNQLKRAQDFIDPYQNKVLIGLNLEGSNDKKILFSELKDICKGLYKLNKNLKIIILSSPSNYYSNEIMINNINLNYIIHSYKTKSILDVAALIKYLDIIISPDTSIIHVASTYNKPIVSIHENNKDSYTLFSPISDLHRTVFAKSQKGIKGFSTDLLLSYSNDLLKLINKNTYSK